ncbi:MAG: chitobiase/beta-hexosaminidase C-terminal domain-containing protein [Spirochaetaceae bacterium]|jgi:beta-glucanase (GH16 family)|nr:chitobiase/beta-hexosaminidase C-terminal domain-containing protein [Spirochaetaceae bacterium]
MKKFLIWMLLLILTVLFSACQQPVGSTQSGDGSSRALEDFDPGNGWSMVWNDEFEGSSLDSSKWNYDIGTGIGGWGNNELQYYTDRQDNVKVENGELVITAVPEVFGGKPFTSGKIHTQGTYSVHYGKIAAKIKLPEGDGMWPAFWMLGQDFDGNNWPAIGELDIMELRGGEDNVVMSTAHWDHNGGYAMYGESFTQEENFSQDYHIFELEWNEQYVYGKVDGETYWTLDNFWAEEGDDPDPKAKSEFQFPMYMILNLAVGGDFFDPSIQDPGLVTSDMPQTMEVDWIRVFEHPDTKYDPWTPGGESVAIFSETHSANDLIAEDEWTTVDTWAESVTIETTTEASEGSEGWKLTVGSAGWMGFGVSSLQGKDFSNFADGYIRFDIKTNSSVGYKLGMRSGPIMENWINLDSGYGYVADNQWHSVSVPVADFLAQNQWFNISQLSLQFMFAGQGATNAGDIIYMDNIHYWTDNPKGTTTVSTPSFSPLPGTYSSSVDVSMACSTEDAVIRYTTDGSEVTSSSAQYVSPISVGSTSTLSAKAFKTGMNDSSGITGQYIINDVQQVATPGFTPAPGEYSSSVNISIQCDTADATIRYTTDGSTVTSSSAQYVSPFAVEDSSTIKAKAFKSGMSDSSEVSGQYVISTIQTVAAPVIGPASGSYTFPMDITIDCATADATIFYAVEYDDYVTEIGPYSGVFSIDSNATVKAYATKSGFIDSAWVSNQYSDKDVPYQWGVIESGSNVTIWFESAEGSSWVDAHYKINNGGQLNVRMINVSTGRQEYDLGSLNDGDTVDLFFTYEVNQLAKDTPWESAVINGEVIEPTANPVIAPAGGYYETSVMVTMNCDTASASIYYTTDGTDPDENSMVYTGGITISANTLLKARGYSANADPSEVVQANYSFPAAESLIIDDYSSSQQWWQGLNDLGQSIETLGGIYNLEGNNNLYFFFNGGSNSEEIVNNVNASIAGYSTLVLTIKGGSGGEESMVEIVLDDGSEHSVDLSSFGNLTTAYKDISIPLSSFNADTSWINDISIRGTGTAKTLRIDQISLQ